jgi:hypothetical protein
LLWPPSGSSPASSAPIVERSELVPCWATLRLGELAPDSDEAFCVTLVACRRANGVRLACAGA